MVKNRMFVCEWYTIVKQNGIRLFAECNFQKCFGITGKYVLIYNKINRKIMTGKSYLYEYRREIRWQENGDYFVQEVCFMEHWF